MTAIALIVLSFCAALANARAWERDPARGGARKCGKAFLSAALKNRDLPGWTGYAFPPGCQQIEIPSTYLVHTDPQNMTEVWDAKGRLAVLIPPNASPPTSVASERQNATIMTAEKTKPPFRVRQYRRGGAQFIEVE